MKKITVFTLSLFFICTILLLTACQNGNNKESLGTSESTLSVQSVESTEKEETEQEARQGTERENHTAEAEETTAVKNKLPEGVVLSGVDFTVTDEEPNEVTYGSDGIWRYASFDDFVYAAEPVEAELKKYRVGDTLIGLTIKSAHFSFLNMHMDNEPHSGGGRVNSGVRLDGTLTLTGSLAAETEDSPLIFKKGDIIFTPDEENIFPSLGGLFEGEENHYMIFCGNLEERDTFEELKALASGESVRAEITVSDIAIDAAMGVPISATIECEIDEVTFL